MPYADKRQQRDYQREWIAKRRASYFEGKVCALCASPHPTVLDHIDPFQKVSHRIWSWSQERREAELAKCQPLCVDCHKEKTNHDGSRVYVAGEWNPASKLTEADVREIRALSTQGWTREDLARRFGVNHSTVSHVVSGETWAYLDAA